MPKNKISDDFVFARGKDVKENVRCDIQEQPSVPQCLAIVVARRCLFNAIAGSIGQSDGPSADCGQFQHSQLDRPIQPLDEDQSSFNGVSVHVSSSSSPIGSVTQTRYSKRYIRIVDVNKILAIFGTGNQKFRSLIRIRSRSSASRSRLYQAPINSLMSIGKWKLKRKWQTRHCYLLWFSKSEFPINLNYLIGDRCGCMFPLVFPTSIE